MAHIPVLTAAVVESLRPTKSSVLVDATMGNVGHGSELIKSLGPKGVYIGIDKDPTAIGKAQQALAKSKPTVHVLEGNFRDIQQLVGSLGYTSVNGIVADLGWRMEQFDGSSGLPRGFSFQSDEPLLMTYGDPDTYPFTAADIVNDWAEEDIANVLYAYGEETRSRRIAKAIVKERAEAYISSAKDLATIIERAVPFHTKGRRSTHPATRSFQALRIAVNDEFDALESLISDGFDLLGPGGRMAIISFHSLEDRIVKQRFRELTRDQQAVLVTKRPRTASPEELAENPRARSAKLRVIEKV